MTHVDFCVSRSVTVNGDKQMEWNQKLSHQLQNIRKNVARDSIALAVDAHIRQNHCDD